MLTPELYFKLNLATSNLNLATSSWILHLCTYSALCRSSPPTHPQLSLPRPLTCSHRHSSRSLTHCPPRSNLPSENYGTSNEALVARFYLNEAFYGVKTLAAACNKADLDAAADSWALCRLTRQP